MKNTWKPYIPKLSEPEYQIILFHFKAFRPLSTSCKMSKKTYFRNRKWSELNFFFYFITLCQYLPLRAATIHARYLPTRRTYLSRQYLTEYYRLKFVYYFEIIFHFYLQKGGTAEAQWLRCCATNRKVAGSIPAGVIDIKSFRSHYGPGVDSASNRNEYQENFLGAKAAGA